MVTVSTLDRPQFIRILMSEDSNDYYDIIFVYFILVIYRKLKYFR